MPNPIYDIGYRYCTMKYDADGETTDWSINFADDYIRPEYVKAAIEDRETRIRTLIDPSRVEMIGPNQVRITPAVADGLRLVIFRDTPKEEPLVDFMDNAILNQANLNMTSRQAVHIGAECIDLIADLLDYFRGVVDLWLSLPDTFIKLKDTPGSYSGQAGKMPIVNNSETALDFIDPGDLFGGAGDFLDLGDTPNSYSGEAGKIPIVNNSENGLTFVDQDDLDLAPHDASFVVLGANSNLTNERILTAGNNIDIQDNGPGGTLVISSTGGGGGGAPTDASYVTLGTHSGLSNERVLTAGSGISITDNGANNTLVIRSDGSQYFRSGDENTETFTGSALLTTDGLATFRHWNSSPPGLVNITGDFWDEAIYGKDVLATVSGAGSIINLYEPPFPPNGSVVTGAVYYGANIRWSGSAKGNIVIGSNIRSGDGAESDNSTVLCCGVRGWFSQSFVSARQQVSTSSDNTFENTTFIANELQSTSTKNRNFRDSVIIGQFLGPSGMLGIYGPYEQSFDSISIGQVTAGPVATGTSIADTSFRGAVSLGGSKVFAHYPGGFTWSIDAHPNVGGSNTGMSHHKIGLSASLSASDEGYAFVGNSVDRYNLNKMWNRNELPNTCHICYTIHGRAIISNASGQTKVVKIEIIAKDALSGGIFAGPSISFQDVEDVDDDGVLGTIAAEIDSGMLKIKATNSDDETLHYNICLEIFAAWHQ